ncbi:hypothetical protein SETIT_8G125600v2 [Setaria italica]|uniref:HVA22-like protein n=3 Tax=Setaria TaxID=4554 RepID=A0A368S7B3_SETIT|nr:HVA22-like protein e [Setaria viridis]RCV38233.1 hypothetical protein SETIT_8G125600v2 [Setaria italica]
MGKLWTILSHLHSLAGPTVTLLYPLYASVQAMESSSKLDDEQWLAYWILYSFITLMEMVLQSLIYWIPILYELKLLFMAWLVLPNFRGAAFIYNMFVREQVKKHNGILAATDADGVSNNVSADKDKITLISPKEKKAKRRLLSMVIPKKLRF